LFWSWDYEIIAQLLGDKINSMTMNLSKMKISWIAGLCGIILLLTANGSYAKTAELWYQDGFHHSIAGKDSSAITAYQGALRLNPNFPQAHHGLALVYYRKGDGVQAVHHLRRAEKLYLQDKSEESLKNLRIVRDNLEKAYKKFDLDPAEFAEMETLHPVPAKESWLAMGKGFLIGDKGYLLTLHPFLQDARKIRVRFSDQSVAEVDLVKRFIIYNVTLLKLRGNQGRGGETLQLANLSDMKVGDRVWALDASAKPASSFTESRVTELKAIQRDSNILQLDLPLREQFPGSPLFTGEGRVAGMILSVAETMKSFQSDGRVPEGNIALKASYFRRVLPTFTGRLPGGKAQVEHTKSASGLTASDRDRILSNIVTVEISK
jgi:S1-C subfamily serine protease